ncbi:MAG: hypothetical protein KDE27_06675, partial [Planctomycetes bacterium]|nr:hypothetical protein [Planctomycetota bacterium]
MTYDPLSYGEIKLRDRAATSGDSPDDILFEDAGPGYASEESPQSDWSEPGDGYTAFGSTGAPNVTQFGADVLGETGGFGEPAAPPAHSPFGGAPAPRPAVARASSAAP